LFKKTVFLFVQPVRKFYFNAAYNNSPSVATAKKTIQNENQEKKPGFIRQTGSQPNTGNYKLL